jgi:hypothetical protein
MSIATLFLTTTLLFGNGGNLLTDTLNIEQKAFQYFVSNIDSIIYIDGSKRQLFDVKTDKIFCSDSSCGKGKIQFAMARAVFKENFLIIDSLQDLSGKLPGITVLSNVQKPLTTGAAYVVTCDHVCFMKDRRNGDIFISVSNRFLYGGFYYVRINVGIGVDWIDNEVYLKFNEQGDIIDKQFTHGIE